jgi:dihydrofolate reductase
MRRLSVFNHLSLDGYFVGASGDFGWAYRGSDDPEYSAFVAGNASGGGELLFGRVTYDLMASYWPTAQAAEQDPAVATGMNRMPKVVFSRTLEQATWSNTRVVGGDIVSAVCAMKGDSGPDMVILGSGSIVAQLAPVGVIDSYQFVVNPIALGRGRTLFERVVEPLRLTLTSTRPFGNGKVFLCYAPAPAG